MNIFSLLGLGIIFLINYYLLFRKKNRYYEQSSTRNKKQRKDDLVKENKNIIIYLALAVISFVFIQLAVPLLGNGIIQKSAVSQVEDSYSSAYEFKLLAKVFYLLYALPLIFLVLFTIELIKKIKHN